jgi:ABC-type amino acid transport substrate-binding protein
METTVEVERKNKAAGKPLSNGFARAGRLCLLILSLALVAPGVLAQTPVDTPRTIRVVVDNAYAPYSFQSDDGKLQGILIDQWRAWEKKTGIKVEIVAMDWDEGLRRMRAGEFDVIDSIVETAEPGITLISLRPMPRSKRPSSFAKTFPASQTWRRSKDFRSGSRRATSRLTNSRRTGSRP